MPAFLAPLLGVAGGAAARVIGTRALAAGASRLGAGALPTGAGGAVGAGRGLSFAQFGGRALNALGGGENKEQPQEKPTPFGGVG